MNFFGYQNFLMIVNLTQKEIQDMLWCPLVDLFLRGVAKLKKLQDEGFIHSSGSIGYDSR